jgi:hypothetical protein
VTRGRTDGPEDLTGDEAVSDESGDLTGDEAVIDGPEDLSATNGDADTSLACNGLPSVGHVAIFMLIAILLTVV